MSIRLIVRFVIMLSFFVFLASFSAGERPVGAQTCGTPDDKKIVADIYDKLKADKGLAAQISHINVISTGGAVKFQGWADSQKDYDRIQSIAVNTDCTKLVNMNNFSETPPPADSQMRSAGGCASGTKPCGDVCIPEGDVCNLSGNTKP